MTVLKGTNWILDAINFMERKLLCRHCNNTPYGIVDPNTLEILVGKDKKIVKGRLTIPLKAMSYEPNREVFAEIYRAADVLLMPSIEKAFGLVAAESLACGTPVIGYATGGLPEVVGNDGSGILVPTGDVGSLAKVIQGSISDKGKAAQMGKKASLRAARLFSLKAQVERFIELYRQIIDQKRRKPS